MDIPTYAFVNIDKETILKKIFWCVLTRETKYFFCVFLSLPDDSDGDIEAPISGQNKWMDGLIREERARNLNGELDSDMEFFVHDYCS